MEKVNLASTGAHPPPTPCTGTSVTTCFHLQLAYFQQPIPSMLGPLLKSLLSNLRILSEKKKERKERISKAARPKKQRGLGRYCIQEQRKLWKPLPGP